MVIVTTHTALVDAARIMRKEMLSSSNFFDGFFFFFFTNEMQCHDLYLLFLA